MIAGSAGIAAATIGRHCMIGGAAGIAGHVTLGDYVIITAKSGVSKSLPKAGIYTSAFPAVDHGEWNSAALVRNLDARERIKALEAALAAQAARTPERIMRDLEPGTASATGPVCQTGPHAGPLQPLHHHRAASA